MTVTPESPSPYSSEFSSLDEKLQEQFGALLHDYAEQLAMYTTPDEMTFETQGATFGQYRDSEIDVKHRVIKSILPGGEPTHTGSVKFSHAEDSTQSLFADHIINWRALTTTWKTSSKVYRGKYILNHLHRNWPIVDRPHPYRPGRLPDRRAWRQWPYGRVPRPRSWPFPGPGSG